MSSAIDEALASALTKFDSLEAYFAKGQDVAAVTTMLLEELCGDADLECRGEGDAAALKATAQRAVGTAYSRWKKDMKAGGEQQQEKPGSVQLPWASITAYPEWVMGQVKNFLEAYDPVRARRELESTLLEQTVISGSVKYDGTCFGKEDSGNLVGRRHALGVDCSSYQMTTTAAAAGCDIGAFKRTLEAAVGIELTRLCVWGELMINPNFYGYAERGLHERWLCFGAVLSFSPGGATQLSRGLAKLGLAHSLGTGTVRLLLCDALREMLEAVGCAVAEDAFPGATHAELVERGAGALIEGEKEGVVVAFARGSGEASLRKWKNSAEGASARQKEAVLLRKQQALCAEMARKERLDARVAAMLARMADVAEAETNPSKKGRAKKKA